jgi:hypothetical protein
MHSRLKELMPKPWTFPYPDRELYTKEQFEKFAELIVKECLDQCYNRGMNDELYEGQLKAASYIEQHFGVEL